jgi:serine/threonine protein kinase
MLNRLRSLQNPRIITLLATYKLRSDYYLMFPLAQHNLRDFWLQTNPSAGRSDYKLWMIREVAGLAGVLSEMHHFGTIAQENTSNPTDTCPAVAVHGDIKPENILLTKELNDLSWEIGKGVLQLADMGLSTFFHDTSQGSAFKGPGTRTYEPPEAQQKLVVGVKSDIWSFGCVILEFIMWFLQGPRALERFTNDRIMATPHSNIPLQDDHFFMLNLDREAKLLGAEVRVTVRKAIQDLYDEPDCTGAIRDILQIVEKDMLVVDQVARIPSGELVSMLRKILAKAGMKPEYLGL